MRLLVEFISDIGGFIVHDRSEYSLSIRLSKVVFQSACFVLELQIISRSKYNQPFTSQGIVINI